jgi:site-specific DNA-methyltransferase (adenine-specific)
MMAKLPAECIDLVVTSPPYDNLRIYNGYEFVFEPIAQQLWRVTKIGGVVVWVVGDETKNGSETGTSFRQALGFMEIGFKLHDTMIYQTDKPPLNHGRYEQEFEYMFIFSKGSLKIFNGLQRSRKSSDNRKDKRYQRKRNGHDVNRGYASQTSTVLRGNIWQINSGTRDTKDKIAFQHPAIFPEALARDHIISWSNPGDIVLDPMIGSGTTAKAAYQLQRHYLGFDSSQEYVDLANKRLVQTQPPLPIKDI